VRRDADCHRIREELEQMLHERFGVEHSTLQVEHVADATGLQIGSSAGARS
jgi:cobalt-zinc-cadmium efflux system protein